MGPQVSPLDDFERDGRIWMRNAISESDLVDFDNAATLQSKAGQRVTSNDALERALSKNSSLLNAIGRLNSSAKPVRVVAFNKSKSVNWGVPWHQDRVIAVAEKHEIQGYGNWTSKSETWHCEPPRGVLEQMLFVRVHLDDTDGSNGAMQISVGSHAKGIVPAAEAEETACQFPIENCEAKRGDVLILKMLTLHSSKPSKRPTNRRVFRVDFASFDLPPPLSWV